MNAQAADSAALRHALELSGLGSLAAPLSDGTQRIYQTKRHGDRAKWQSIIEQFADIAISSHDFTGPVVRIGQPHDCGNEEKARLERLLRQLKPWRKGPFALFGILIDSEWQSNHKWNRLAGEISCLRGRRVLDVGCGNGYYLWRMLGQGAAIALGIDPSELFIAQFNALKRYCRDCPAFILPLKSEQFPVAGNAGDSDFDPAGFDSAGFDTVFSMGVLSHRRNPHAHLRELMSFARPGGELIIETLVVDGGTDSVLVPAGRYAKMRNVYAIPSPLALESWLRQAGVTDLRLIDVSKTTADEQRTTEWMEFESLPDFLDPTDPNKTIEGHPAPQRGIFICRKPE